MICNKCGENNLDNAKFCRSCGANLGQPNTQNDEKQQVNKINFDIKRILSNKKLIIGAASTVLAVVVLIIAISVISSLTKTELYVTTENNISYAYSPDTEKTSVFFNDVLLASPINGKATKVSSSINGKIAAFISEDNVLYIVEKDVIQKIADDIIDAEISYNGNVMAYLNQDNVLYTIQLNNRKIEKVADDVVEVDELDDCWFTFSPDGNTLLYITQEEDEFVSYIKNGSTKTKLENFGGLFTSNNGKTIYGLGEDKKSESYIDEMLGVYDLNAGSSMKLSNSCDDLLLNSNHNELLFAFESKYYLSIGGEERIKIGNYTYLRPILPDNASNMGTQFVSSVNSFVGTLMVYCEDGTYGIGYIDDNYEMQEVIKNIGSYRNYVYLTDDYNTVYYIRNESLYMATRELNFEPEKLISDVEYYQVSSDGKKIYYVNSDGELLCRYKDEDKMIAEDVSTYSLSITDKGTVFFLTDYSDGSGILYRCSDGKNKVRVADDVYTVYVYPEYIKYYTEMDSNNEYTIDIYISTNEKDFKKVADDVKTSY